jgi:hypothetical protein
MDWHGAGLFGGAVKKAFIDMCKDNPYLVFAFLIVVACLIAGRDLP